MCKRYLSAKTWCLCQHPYTHSSSGLVPTRSRQCNEYMPKSVKNAKKKSSHLNQKKCKAQKNVSRLINRYGEYTGDLITVAGAQELHIQVSFFKALLNIQLVGAGGGGSHHNLKIFLKLKVSCEMEAIMCTVSEMSCFNFQILF